MGFNGDSGASCPAVCGVGVERCVRTERSPLCLDGDGAVGRGSSAMTSPDPEL